MTGRFAFPPVPELAAFHTAALHLVDARFAAFLAVSAALIVAPGPDMVLVTRNALSSGRRAASFTAWGVGLGILGWAIASTLGVGILLERSAVLFAFLKLAGATYLGFLGLRSLLGSLRGDRGETGEPLPSAGPLDDGAALRQGILGNLLNPKAGVIFVSILPQFVRPGDSPLRLILMLVAFEVMLLVWLNMYGYLVSRAGRSRLSLRVRRGLDRVAGVVLIGLGVRLAVERR